MADINLDALTPDQGSLLLASTAGPTFGSELRRLGDVNADGFADFQIEQGRVAYIVYGSATGLPASLTPATMPLSQGFAITSPVGTSAGFQTVVDAGDVNADGIADIVLGLGLGDEAYVIYGRAGNFAGPVDPLSLTAAEGFALHGAALSRAGQVVASAGDVNGDGVDDLLITAPAAMSLAGAAYVVFGQAGGLAGPVTLDALTASQGFRIDGAPGLQLGNTAAAGDINGDGLGDLLLQSQVNGPAGAIHVVYGRAGGYAAPLEVTNLAPDQGFRIDGYNLGGVNGEAGFRLAVLGDVNGDGRDDIGIMMNDGLGIIHVVFGPSSNPSAPLSLLNLLPEQGFRIDGLAPPAVAALPPSLAAAGDVNGDGLGDILIGSPWQAFGGLVTGAAYVIYGKAGAGAPVSIPWLTAQQGLVIAGAALDDVTGFAVAGAGDANGDGYGDILVSAPFAGNGTVYLVHGPNQPVTWTGGAGAETKPGSSFEDVLNGAGGNDSLDAKGGNDSLLGGADNDSLAGGTGTDLLDGGAGNDSLDGGAGADTMIGGAGNDTYVVDDAGDVLLEDAAGLAAVLSSVTWTLAANFLDLTLTGTAAIDGTGNGRQNWMIGNEAANRLSGGGGDDLLEGHGGNDKLTGGGGHDLLRGEAGRDNLNGGGGDDSLDGGAEADKLSGGTGADRFIFSVAPVAKQSDTVSDFSAAQGDRIEILRAAFDPGGTSGLGLGQVSLQAGRFEANLAGQATAATTRFVYDTDAGSLLWDADGTGATKAVEVARFTGLPALSAADLWLV